MESKNDRREQLKPRLRSLRGFGAEESSLLASILGESHKSLADTKKGNSPVKTRAKQDRFYEEAKRSVSQKREREEAETKALRAAAGESRMSAASKQLLQERKARDVALAISRADPGRLRRLDFSMLGRVLTLLDCFAALAFDERARINRSPDSHDPADPARARRLEDQKLHLLVFELGVAIDGQSDTIAADTLFAILAPLFSPDPPARQLEALNSLLNSVGLDSRSLCRCLGLAADLSQTFVRLRREQRLRFSTSRSPNPPEVPEPTFRPQLNRRSVELSRAARADSVSRNQLRKNVAQAQASARAEREQKECTFRPQINAKSREMGLSGLHRATSNHRVPPERVDREEAELAQCTFKPILSSFVPPNEVPLPASFDKTVGRLRFATEQRLWKQAVESHIPTGETYAYWKSLPENPPKCAAKYTVRAQEPIVILNVNIGGGKTGKVALRPSDDPASKARDFALAFGISSDMEDGLRDLLQQYLDAHNQQEPPLGNPKSERTSGFY